MASVTCRGDLHTITSADPLTITRPCLDIIATKLQPEPAITEITEKCLLESSLPCEPSSPDTDTPRMKGIDPPNPETPDSPTHAGQPRTVSRPTSTATSTHHSRSASRSTARSRPPSRHGSFHSTRRAVPNASIVPVPPARTSQERRESLLLFHRESCRLFQDPDPSTDDTRPVSSLQRAPSTTYRSRREARTSSETGGSAPPSPMASSYSSRRPDYEHRRSLSSAAASPPFRPRDRSNTLPNNASSANHVRSSSISSIHIPATVMEWTSASTRRREYEKIDRASRGVRGLWRRVAPRWCQARDSRTPFFEEGKTSGEGSVRRFRMDLPDEEATVEPDAREKTPVPFLDSRGKGSSEKNPRRRWTYHRSKTT